ncbi:MAG TPA: energy-coupling factor transporter transmembrane component T [Candidatus Limnocylindrales bacterium]
MPTAYHRLNPLTKMTVAAAGSVAALAVGGYVVPLAVAAAMLLGASVAHLAGRLLGLSLLVSLPIAVSVVLVSVFTRVGTTVLFSIGPFDATLQGADFAGQTLVRLLAIALSVGLFSTTTDPRALVADLERRGAPPRLAFVALATVEAVPTLAERARVIAEAQRARGLDTEGGLVARARGLLPIVGPAILSSLTDVEERSLALETRGFTRPGRRELLWSVPDSARQTFARRLLLATLVVLVAAHAARLV